MARHPLVYSVTLALTMGVLSAPAPCQPVTPPLAVCQAVVSASGAYAWTVDDPAQDESGGTTSTTLTQIPNGRGQSHARKVHLWLIDRGHGFPLRWHIDPDGGLWGCTFFMGEPSHPFVPTWSSAFRIPPELIPNNGTSPKPDPLKHEGFNLLDEDLSVKFYIGAPYSRRLVRGFLAAYRDDRTPDTLVRYEAQPLGTRKRPIFTYDFSLPGQSDAAWTLYVQRAPLQAIDVISFTPSVGLDPKFEKVHKLESFGVPFDEPFFAHRDAATGEVFFVTERTGRVFAAAPPAAGAGDWRVRAVWYDAARPVAALVRDSRDGSAYACVANGGRAGQGGEALLRLSGTPQPAAVDLRAVERPVVPAGQLSAAWFARVVAARTPPAKP